MHDRSTVATPSEGRRLLTPPEAAYHLSLAVSTLANWRALRLGPPWSKVGGRVRYRLDQLDAWVDVVQADAQHDEEAR